MRKRRFTEEQIIEVLKEAESGITCISMNPCAEKLATQLVQQENLSLKNVPMFLEYIRGTADRREWIYLLWAANAWQRDQCMIDAAG